MTYAQVIEYLYEQLPMFHRIGAAAYKPSLDNTHALCKWLRHPESQVTTIHVGGTNGKGSTSHLIAATLQTAGYKVGLYTSPHLIDFRERIKINGECITQQAVIDFVMQYKNADWSAIQPSFFELTFAMAMQYFFQEKVDVAVIEVGMGGRLDSTNVIHPILSIITNVSLDHQKFLGEDIPQIAQEKSGIIKRNTPVVLGPMNAMAKNVMLQKAINQGAAVHEVKMEDDAPDCSLLGSYQEQNKRTAFKALQVIMSSFPNLNHNHITTAFRDVSSLTGIRGRWEILQKEPLTIADVGHNEEGIKSVLAQVKKTPHHELHVVIGMVEDKDLKTVLSLFPKSAYYYFCKANIPRGMNAHQLAQIASNYELQGFVYESVEAAYTKAQAQAKPNDLVLVTGSFFTVAEILNTIP